MIKYDLIRIHVDSTEGLNQYKGRAYGYTSDWDQSENRNWTNTQSNQLKCCSAHNTREADIRFIFLLPDIFKDHTGNVHFGINRTSEVDKIVSGITENYNNHFRVNDGAKKPAFPPYLNATHLTTVDEGTGYIEFLAPFYSNGYEIKGHAYPWKIYDYTPDIYAYIEFGADFSYITNNNLVNYPIKFSADLFHVTKVELRIFKIGEDESNPTYVKTVSTSLTDNKVEITLPGNVLGEGYYNFDLEYWHNDESRIKQITAIRLGALKEPKILALEPSKVAVSKEDLIPVSWMSENQATFKVEVDGRIYTGTTARRISIPVGTFTTLGEKSLKLTLTYQNPTGEIFTAEKSTTFTVIGQPSTPYFDSKENYTIAMPTIEYFCNDQFVQAVIEIVDSDNNIVYNSGNLKVSPSLINGVYKASHTLTKSLDNNISYIAYVKVKTTYGYWSNAGSKRFMINAAIANRPSIELFVSDNSIIINANTIIDRYFASTEIWRKTEHSDWIRIACNLPPDISYQDFHVSNDTYFYKVVSVSKTDARNESEICSARIKLRDFHFADVDDIENEIIFAYYPKADFTYVKDVAANQYLGVNLPIVERGQYNYRTLNCNFTCSEQQYNKFIKMIEQARILLYRDGRGKKMYCQVTSNISDSFKRYSKDCAMRDISFTCTEVYYDETDTFVGTDNKYIATWNGTYKFNGNLTWNGIYIEEQRNENK